MKKNLEIKVRVNSLETIKKKLKSLSLNPVAVLNQTDIYYKNNEGRLKLRIENDKPSLIHYQRVENGKTRWSDYSILEINKSGKEATEFLERIFTTINTVKKVRVLYLYKDTRIHLDEVMGLGSFIELETVVKKSKKIAEEEFNLLLNLLKLNKKNQFLGSYNDLSGK